MTKSALYILVLIAGLAFASAGCRQNQAKKATTERQDSLSVAVYELKGGGWAYDISHGKKLFIRQEYIPAISGYIPFASHDDAEKVAEKVLEKLRTQPGMPAITREELLDMKIAGVK